MMMDAIPMHEAISQLSKDGVQAPGDSSDATLVAHALEGDRQAFEELVRKHQAALFRRARWMGLDADTAADLVQDAFVKAYTNLHACREPNRFGYWIGRILRNNVLDFSKARTGAAFRFRHPSDDGW
jgi:RNA polymerase sigma-70 factor (ECF subfamily)